MIYCKIVRYGGIESVKWQFVIEVAQAMGYYEKHLYRTFISWKTWSILRDNIFKNDKNFFILHCKSDNENLANICQKVLRYDLYFERTK
jgi:hypothetical protein